MYNVFEYVDDRRMRTVAELKNALLDAGASENTLKRVEDACASHQVPLYRISPGALGHAIGKPGRMVISVPAGRMADKLLTYFQEH